MKKDLLLKDFKSKGLELNRKQLNNTKGGAVPWMCEEMTPTDDPSSSEGWSDDCQTVCDTCPLAI